MENLRYPIKLNMENTGSLLTSIRLKQGDSAITFVLRIFKNGQNVFSVDDIPSIVFNRPDGSAVIGECSVAEGQYTYKILGNELQYPGQIRADIKFDIYTETESSTTFLFECVKDTLPQNIHGAGIYVNSLKDIKDYLDQTVIKLEQELAAFDLQQVLDAVNYVQESADEIEVLMPEIRGVTGDVSNLKETVGNNDISKVGEDVTQSIINLYNSNNLYATCTTAESITAKVGVLSSYALVTGGVVVVKFTNAVPASATLNINSKGAKPIYYKGAAISDGIIKAGDMVTFMYNGTAYMLISIDRWQSDLEQLNSNLGKIQHKTFTITSKTPANSYSFYNYDVEVPSGCKIATVSLSIRSSVWFSIDLDSIDRNTNTIYFSIKNSNSSELEKTVDIDVLFIPE